MTSAINKVCSSCKASFPCGGDCWCTNYPPIMPMNNGPLENCLCEKCLSKQVITTIETYMENLSSEKIKKIQGMDKPKKLINGIDFNINQQGKLVFTKWYLLRRGHCCEFGCLNCPYH